MSMKRNWVLGFLLASMPFSVSIENLRDAPYVFLTGFSEHELVELAYLPDRELEERIGFHGMPAEFTRNRTQKDRVAHAVASYLGTLRWGPDVTLACGYMREYVPWILWRKQADPADIAANYAGVAVALRVVESQP